MSQAKQHHVIFTKNTLTLLGSLILVLFLSLVFAPVYNCSFLPKNTAQATIISKTMIPAKIGIRKIRKIDNSPSCWGRCLGLRNEWIDEEYPIPPQWSFIIRLENPLEQIRIDVNEAIFQNRQEGDVVKIIYGRGRLDHGLHNVVVQDL